MRFLSWLHLVLQIPAGIVSYVVLVIALNLAAYSDVVALASERLGVFLRRAEAQAAV